MYQQLLSCLLAFFSISGGVFGAVPDEVGGIVTNKELVDSRSDWKMGLVGTAMSAAIDNNDSFNFFDENADFCTDPVRFGDYGDVSMSRIGIFDAFTADVHSMLLKESLEGKGGAILLDQTLVHYDASCEIYAIDTQKTQLDPISYAALHVKAGKIPVEDFPIAGYFPTGPSLNECPIVATFQINFNLNLNPFQKKFHIYKNIQPEHTGLKESSFLPISVYLYPYGNDNVHFYLSCPVYGIIFNAYHRNKHIVMYANPKCNWKQLKLFEGASPAIEAELLFLSI